MAAIIGKVFDAETGKPVYNAHVIFTDKNGKPYSPLVGTVTDFDGSYSFATLGGAYLKVTHISYKPQIKAVDLTNFGSGGSYSQIINFTLQPSNIQLPEVVIHGKNWITRNKWVFPIAGILLFFGIKFKNKN